MTVETLVTTLSEKSPYAAGIAGVCLFPSKVVEYGTLDHPLPAAIRNGLEKKGVSLYSHQAAAIRAFRSGQNFILTSSTASGKTLAFLLPLFERLASDPQATALLIYPTKALAYDQLKSVEELSSATGIKVRTAVYDGDTPRDKRPEILFLIHLIFKFLQRRKTSVAEGGIAHASRWCGIEESCG